MYIIAAGLPHPLSAEDREGKSESDAACHVPGREPAASNYGLLSHLSLSLGLVAYIFGLLGFPGRPQSTLNKRLFLKRDH